MGEITVEKYLKINEVSKLLGISSHNIRYYDKEGLLNLEHKSEKGYRLFTYKDIDYLSGIMILRYSQIPIKEVKELIEDFNPDKYMDALEKSSNNIDNEIKRLNNIKSEISEIISGYKNSKLGFYTKEEDIRYVIPMKSCSFEETLTEREFYNFITKHKISFEDLYKISIIYIMYEDHIEFCLVYDYKDLNIDGKEIEGGEYLCYKFLASSNDEIVDAVGDMIKYIVKNRLYVHEDEMILKELDAESLYHQLNEGKVYELQIKIIK